MRLRFIAASLFIFLMAYGCTIDTPPTSLQPTPFSTIIPAENRVTQPAAVLRQTQPATPPLPTTHQPSSTPTVTPRPPGWPTATFAIRSPGPTHTPGPTTTPSATALPTATPFPIPPLSGTLYFARGSELAMIELETGKERPLGISNARWFTVSPNEERIAVVHQSKLTVITMATAVSTTFDITGTSFVHWSPDSGALVLTRQWQEQTTTGERCEYTSEVLLIEVASGVQRRLGPGCQPRWSPDSTRIAFLRLDDQEQGQNSLYIVNREGEHGWSPIQSGRTSAQVPTPLKWLSDPFWSADSASIFVLGLLTEECLLSSFHALAMVDLASGSLTTVAILGDFGNPLPDPTGRYMASVGYRPIGYSYLMIFELLGEAYDHRSNPCVNFPIQLRTHGPLAMTQDVYNATWSPDGEFLAVLYREGPVSPGQQGPFELRLSHRNSDNLSEPLVHHIDGAHIEWRP